MYSDVMSRKESRLTRVFSVCNHLWSETDLRNNVVLLFSLFYGVYFGFFIGLPLVLNISYVLATGWLMILALVGILTAIKIMMVVSFEVKELSHWALIRIKGSLQTFGWKIQSAH